MTTEIISVGTEFILGQIPDTNAGFLSQRLAAIGVEPAFRVTVGQVRQHLVQVLSVALQRSEVVVLVGGLGPTERDYTREVVSELTDTPLVYHPELMAQIEEFFHRIRKTPSPGHSLQARIPEGALPIPNPIGSAPGFILKHQGKAIVALSAVPAELQHMTHRALVPFLIERFGLRSRVHSRILKITGLDEPLVSRELGDLIRTSTNPTLCVVSYPGEVQVRLMAWAEGRGEGNDLISALESHVRERFGDFVYGQDEDTLETVVARLLSKRGMTISVVETYTSGRICDRLYKTSPSVLKEGRVVGRMIADTQSRGWERVAEQLSDMIRQETEASVGLAAVSETVAGIESTNLWVAVTSAARKQIGTALMARGAEVNQARAVAFCLDQVRRFVRAESALAQNSSDEGVRASAYR